LKKKEERADFEGEKKYSDWQMFLFITSFATAFMSLACVFFFSKYIGQVIMFIIICYYLNFCLAFGEGVLENSGYQI
jgi:hypothetical protein